MQIVELKTADLKPYEKNPRYNDNAVDAVAESIKEFGFKVPIVIDKNNVIVAGHTRLKAANKLGLETVPCVIADDLTEEQIKAFRLADNKTAEFAIWDLEMLNDELLSINDIDMQLFGFDVDIDLGDDDDKDIDEIEPEDNYRIAYEMVFNSEEEQEEWFEFLSYVKAKYPDLDTISERVLCAIREWRNG